MIDLKNKKVILTGGNGFLGSYIKKKLIEHGCQSIFIPTHDKYDLTEIESVKRMFATNPADIVIHAAGDVGGIGYSRKYPAQQFYNNLMMNTLVMDQAYKHGIEKFVGIGSVCAYPKFTKVPFNEKDLWEGFPEETNAPYGLSKRMMLIQGQAYRQQYGFNAIHLLLINLYGPGDNFDPETSHVIPAMIQKILDVKEQGKKRVEVWGTGSASREFVFVEDAAEGIVKATEMYDKAEPVNIGADFEISIKDLIALLMSILNVHAELVWDTTKPDGQPRRRLDLTRAKEYFNYEPKVSLEEGLRRTIDWWLSNRNKEENDK